MLYVILWRYYTVETHTYCSEWSNSNDPGGHHSSPPDKTGSRGTAGERTLVWHCATELVLIRHQRPRDGRHSQHNLPHLYGGGWQGRTFVIGDFCMWVWRMIVYWASGTDNSNKPHIDTEHNSGQDERLGAVMHSPCSLISECPRRVC